MSEAKQRPPWRTVQSALTGAALLALAACGGGAPRVPPPPRPISGVQPLSAEASAALNSPQLFVALAGSQSLFSVRASEMAVSRVSDYRLRAVADEIAHEQLGIGAQLSFAGRRLDLLPSAELGAHHQAMLDELRGAANFDATYKRQQSAVLNEAWALHRAYAVRGSSPTLRPVSVMAAPILGREVSALRKI